MQRAGRRVLLRDRRELTAAQHERAHAVGRETRGQHEGVHHAASCLRDGGDDRRRHGHVELDRKDARPERSRQVLLVGLDDEGRREVPIEVAPDAIVDAVVVDARQGPISASRLGASSEIAEDTDERGDALSVLFDARRLGVGDEHDDVGRLEEVLAPMEELRLPRNAHELTTNAAAVDEAACEVEPIEELRPPSRALGARMFAPALERDRGEECWMFVVLPASGMPSYTMRMMMSPLRSSMRGMSGSVL